MKRWAWWEHAKGLVVLGVLVVGCGGKAETPARDSSGGAGAGGAPDADLPAPGSGVPSNVTGGLGWSLRDDTPVSSVGVSAAVDTVADRLLVFGGNSQDLWSMPLSGAFENCWLRLTLEGEVPPPSQPVSVYDSRRNRVLALLNGWVGESEDPDQVQLWELSLGKTPSWRHVQPPGVSPRRELFQGRLALDSDGDRLFALGGNRDRNGTWALSLENAGEWTRLADAPPESSGWSAANESGAALVFDAPRQRLVVFGLRNAWELPLDTGQWSALPDVPGGCLVSTPALDAASERVIFVSGVCGGVRAFSLAENSWSGTKTPPTVNSVEYGATAVDVERGRVLLAYSGTYAKITANDTWQLDLDSFDLRQLTPDGRGLPLVEGVGAVWDPVREAVVAFGSEAQRTASHALEASAGWRTLDTDSGPVGWRPGAIYDPTASAVLSFGGAQIDPDVETVWSLASEVGTGWQALDVSSGPVGRANNLSAYDSIQRRWVIQGGEHNPLYTDKRRLLDDTWVLALDGEPTWTRLAPAGKGPGPRAGMVGGVDAAHGRLIAYGGHNAKADRQDLFALSLGDDPTWSLLEPAGAAPLLDNPTAVYDAEGQRMIFVSIAFTGNIVAALELSEEPTWHTFCQPNDPPPSYPPPVIALVPDGLFVGVGSATFRFDLATPYCD